MTPRETAGRAAGGEEVAELRCHRVGVGHLGVQDGFLDDHDEAVSLFVNDAGAFEPSARGLRAVVDVQVVDSCGDTEDGESVALCLQQAGDDAGGIDPEVLGLAGRLHSAVLDVAQSGADLVAPLPVHRLGVDGLHDEILRLSVRPGRGAPPSDVVRGGPGEGVLDA